MRPMMINDNKKMKSEQKILLLSSSPTYHRARLVCQISAESAIEARIRIRPSTRLLMPPFVAVVVAILIVITVRILRHTPTGSVRS